MAIRALGKALMKAGVMPSQHFLDKEAEIQKKKDEAKVKRKAEATANLTMKGIVDGCN